MASLDRDVDVADLDLMPPKGKLGRAVSWTVSAAILLFIAYGFMHSGKSVGSHMLAWWTLGTSVFAGLGAAAALAHPLSILSAVAVAPLTTFLHPILRAGWVSGLVEAVVRKPQVKDLEHLPEDILSFKGFWRNKVTRVLLVVSLTNVGALLGGVLGVTLMVKAFQ
jgi:pheromone shutdown protein TraB